MEESLFLFFAGRGKPSFSRSRLEILSWNTFFATSLPSYLSRTHKPADVYGEMMGRVEEQERKKKRGQKGNVEPAAMAHRGRHIERMEM